MSDPARDAPHDRSGDVEATADAEPTSHDDPRDPLNVDDATPDADLSSPAD